MRRPLTALTVALSLTSIAGAGEPARPPSPATQAAPARGPAHLRPALRERVACGPEAARAGAVLQAAAVTWRLDLEQAATLERLVAGDEALRHADLATLALALAFEHELPFEAVGPARREALLDALMGPAIPESECLPAEAVTRLRGRLLYVACLELEERRADVSRWAQNGARPYLLLAERAGPPIPGNCRLELRRELGDPAEIGRRGGLSPEELARPGGSNVVPLPEAPAQPPAP